MTAETDDRERWERERDGDFDDEEDDLLAGTGLGRGESSDDDDDSTDGDDEEPVSDADASVEVVLNHIETQEALKAQQAVEDAEFRQQLAENLPGYQPPPEPLSKYEEAAKVAASMDPGSAEWTNFMAELTKAGEDRMRAARGGEEGFDLDGDPLVVSEPFDPSTLDSAAFNAYVTAVASGGAVDMRKVPSGWKYDDWVAAVESGMGARE